MSKKTISISLVLIFAILILVCGVLASAGERSPAATEISETVRVPGDMNDDGDVNSKDVTLLRRFIANYDVVINTAMADVNADGSIDVKDVVLIRHYIAGYDVELFPTPPVYSELGEKVQIYGSFGAGVRVYAHSIYPNNNYHISISETKSYFLFTPDETGIYKVTYESDVDAYIGTYGNPAYVLKNDITSSADEMSRVDDSTILIDVSTAHLASESRAASKYLIGVHGSAFGTGVLKFERVADHVITPEELPYTPYGADFKPEFYIPNQKDNESFKLVNFNLTDPNLKIVYNGSDGYYHYMSVDGPIVLVKLELSAQYLGASIKDVCSKQNFGCYIYDEDGDFAEKITYHDMMLAYIKSCATNKGGVGAYPLDEHLMMALKNVGASKGWYDFDSAGSEFEKHIFGEEVDRIIKENAWMFALCYEYVSE